MYENSDCYYFLLFFFVIKNKWEKIIMNEKKWKMENKYEKRLQRAESDSHVHAAYETTFKKKKKIQNF